MLKKSEPAVRLRRAGTLAVCALVATTSYAAWAFRPADVAVAAAVATESPSARAIEREARVLQESRMLAPPYPSEAIAAGISGKVVLRVLVGVDGSVKDVVVEHSEPAGVFDAVTIDAARQWRFSPAIRDGAPAESWLRVPVNFDAEEPAEPEA